MLGTLGQEITETAYLTARTNTKRYRYILRYFYEQYQRTNYWLQPEEILSGVRTMGLEEDYDMEKLQADLSQLEGWKSLTAQHDSTRVTTIEEYLKKRYRYMMTPYAIEIERLVIQLENVKGYGGSLQPSKLQEFVRLAKAIRWWSQVRSEVEAVELWDELIDLFKDLNERASDYIASLNSKRSEELFATEQFLAYKDSVLTYLQNFIQVLQNTAPEISELLLQAKQDSYSTARFLHQVVSAKMGMPNLDEPLSAEQWEERINSQWRNVERWFLGTKQESSLVSLLEQMAKDTIFKVVRSAIRIQEKGRSGMSRQQELEQVGRWFLQTESLEEAHELYAYTFGLYETRHFFGEHAEDNGYLDETSMWETTPQEFSLPPRGHQGRPRNTNTAPVIARKNNPVSLQAYLKKKQEEESLIETYVNRGSVLMSELGVVSKGERQQLLSWISRCLANKNLQFRTPDGIRIAMPNRPNLDRTILVCEDGELEMPNYTLYFSREGEPS
ncbi:TIGR02677 family protein [Tumebacillus sp. ITR2]|uniref:TIGR02677 family protein n=1 Tax=Tumebacillus amylolyticus TaxID=2801339 RepID=A0ABS1JGR4_9BACL|nr:TIGR02677 family protein [Tumebacillus amylolyticus]MBL0389482.1 TIGR02677 family protein [Tumebacillus amylolyticus]